MHYEVEGIKASTDVDKEDNVQRKTMAELSDGKTTVPVTENASLVEHGEELGIPFSCTEGNCGTCLTRIVEGMENMSGYSEKEKIFGLEEDERLICQARILKGRVVVDI